METISHDDTTATEAENNTPSTTHEKNVLSGSDTAMAVSIEAITLSTACDEQKNGGQARNHESHADAEKTVKSRGVQFLPAEASGAEAGDSNLMTASPETDDDSVKKRKSRMSRLLKGDGGTMKRSKTRKSMASASAIMFGGKGMAKRTTSGKHSDALQGRKTVGTQSMAIGGNDEENDGHSNVYMQIDDDSSAPRGRSQARNDQPDRPTRKVGEVKEGNRSRSASRGPRRGRDRFRGVGTIFSTSKARNAPRPPRATVDGEDAEGSSSKALLSRLRAKRMASPSPTRDSFDSEHAVFKSSSEATWMVTDVAE